MGSTDRDLNSGTPRTWWPCEVFQCGECTTITSMSSASSVRRSRSYPPAEPFPPTLGRWLVLGRVFSVDKVGRVRRERTRHDDQFGTQSWGLQGHAPAWWQGVGDREPDLSTRRGRPSDDLTVWWASTGQGCRGAPMTRLPGRSDLVHVHLREWTWRCIHPRMDLYQRVFVAFRELPGGRKPSRPAWSSLR